MKSAIIAELTLTQSTLATRRNIQKLLAATDLAEAARTAIQQITLTANNEDEDAPNATYVVGDVSNFLHLAVTAPVLLFFSAPEMIGTTAYLTVQRHFTLTGRLSGVTMRNLSLTQIVQAKVISA